MPDHVHKLLVGRTEHADLRRMVVRWKQATGFAWSRLGHGRLWQEGYWERIVRDDEDTLGIARYIVENPVRAGLVSAAVDYPLSGSTEHTLEEILEAIQMDYRWRH